MKAAAIQHSGSRSPRERFVRFSLVGVIGIVVQLVALRILTQAFGLGYLMATALAVEITILHNFVWHEWFTWNDRTPSGTAEVLRRFLRLNGSTGGLSLVGNVGLTHTLVAVAHIDIFLSNLIAVGFCSTLNFLISDRVIFTVPINKKASQPET